MAQLSSIKQRIHAVKKTEKITRAMRLIAMSLYSKLERKKVTLSEYEQAMSQLTGLLKEHADAIPPLFVPKAETDSRPLVIVCSSTKGLCGGLNSNILRYFEKTFVIEPHQRASFIGLGARACSFLKKRHASRVVYSNPECTIPTLSSIASTILSLICAQKETPYTTVTVYYTHLKNFFLQVPLKATLIPLDLKSDEANTADTGDTAEANQYIWEQPPPVLGKTIARQLVHTKLVHMLFDNLISENAARFIAMDQSTNNAEKYLDSLNMAYNKSRQSLITREIAELSSNMDEK